MIALIRKLRRRMLAEGRFSKYLAYAVGEIVLVVIGILIALQINNYNDAREERARELRYLVNIRADLVANISEMDRYLATRTELVASAQRIIRHFEGEAIEDLSAFNADGVGIYSWQRYYQINNTFRELINSGNFALLSNDRIKHGLLDLESQYLKMKGEEDHFRFDAETLLYNPLYESMDLTPIVMDFAYRVSNGQAGRDGMLSEQTFADYLQNRKLKNGFVMTALEFETMNEQMREMKRLSQSLMDEIDAELQR
ncbi:DUF6090 family protein [Dokdonella sp.]|uniref:DUF6090 family protein n=1 Tax=Dokdonella sp. TaxID=2291710 RepID=UPI003529B741